jgi:primosomal protein N'
VEAAADGLAEALRRELGPRGMQILGPAPAVFPRLNDRYRFQILVKGAFNAEKRDWLAGCLSSFREAYKKVDVLHDMDPLAVY